MRRAAAAAVIAALAAPVAGAALPAHGLVVPGRSLGGIRLGMTEAQVKRRWGSSYGVCRGCRLTTWYFNYRPFRPQGAGVAFRHGRVVAVFTLWSPRGWHTIEGLRIGEDEARVTALYGALLRSECGDYAALAVRKRATLTVFYVVNHKVWGFGLSRPGIPPCR